MKVSCIISSYNRPRWLRQSIRSIVEQSHKDYQIVVIDESTMFDIYEVLKEFDLSECVVRKHVVTQEQRSRQNRLSINLNVGLALADGDLICFLADDDYYYPTWFEKAAAFFSEFPEVQAAYGKLVYSDSPEMVFTESPAQCNLRFFKGPLQDPFNRLDHNQAIHRKFDPPFQWPEDMGALGGPDAFYFREVATKHLFYPIDAWAAVKRVHSKNLQCALDQYKAGMIDESRE